MRNPGVLVAVLAVYAMVAVGCDEAGDGVPDVTIIVPDSVLADQWAPDVVAEDTSEDAAGDRGNVSPDVPDDDVVQPSDSVQDSVVPEDSGRDDVVDIDDAVLTDANEVVVPKCWLGQEQCQPLDATNRMTCETAQIIGRVSLSNGYERTADTINKNLGNNRNDDELDDDGCRWFPGDDDPLWCQSKCDDDGLDHFFRVYLIPGDYFSVSVSDYLVYDKYGTNIDFMFKVYKGNTCPLNRDLLQSCTNDKLKNPNNVEVVQIKPMTQDEAGWYTIVLDSVAEDHAGTYTMSANLFQNSEYTGDWDLCCDFPSY